MTQFFVKRGDIVYIYSDGIGDNLLPEEISIITRGQYYADAFRAIIDTVTGRMLRYGLESHSGQYHFSKIFGPCKDGFWQPPKADNRSLVAIQI